MHAAQKAAYSVPRFITGKFCEHLYFNVTNGMDAQILKNPTFSDYPFSTGQMSPDGIATFHYGKEEIARAIRGDAEALGLANVGYRCPGQVPKRGRGVLVGQVGRCRSQPGHRALRRTSAAHCGPRCGPGHIPMDLAAVTSDPQV